MFAEMAPVSSSTRGALEQTGHVPRYMIQATTQGELMFYIRKHFLHDVQLAGEGRLAIEQERVNLVQASGVLVGRAAEHNPVYLQQQLAALLHRIDAAVNHKLQFRKGLLKLEYAIVLQWRDFTVLLWAEAIQPGFSSMHDKSATSRLGYRFYKVVQVLVRIKLVDTNPMLDGHGYVRSI